MKLKIILARFARVIQPYVIIAISDISSRSLGKPDFPTMDGMELGPPDSMAELCMQASNQSIDFGLTCTSLTEKLKFLKPIRSGLTTQGPGVGSEEEQLNLTTISAVNVELEASGTSAASEATVYQREDESNMDKLIVLTIIIVFTVIGNLGVVLAILLRR